LFLHLFNVNQTSAITQTIFILNVMKKIPVFLNEWKKWQRNFWTHRQSNKDDWWNEKKAHQYMPCLRFNSIFSLRFTYSEIFNFSLSFSLSQVLLNNSSAINEKKNGNWSKTVDHDNNDGSISLKVKTTIGHIHTYLLWKSGSIIKDGTFLVHFYYKNVLLWSISAAGAWNCL